MMKEGRGASFCSCSFSCFVTKIGPVHRRLPVSRLYRRADLRSYARHPNPLNLPRRATLPPVTARVRLRPTNSLAVRGRAVLLTHNRDAKLAEIRSTAARITQSGKAGCPVARFGNIGPLHPSMFRRQIFPSGSLPPEQSSGSAVSASLF